MPIPAVIAAPSAQSVASATAAAKPAPAGGFLALVGAATRLPGVEVGVVDPSSAEKAGFAADPDRADGVDAALPAAPAAPGIAAHGVTPPASDRSHTARHVHAGSEPAIPAPAVAVAAGLPAGAAPSPAATPRIPPRGSEPDHAGRDRATDVRAVSPGAVTAGSAEAAKPGAAGALSAATLPPAAADAGAGGDDEPADGDVATVPGANAAGKAASTRAQKGGGGPADPGDATIQPAGQSGATPDLAQAFQNRAVTADTAPAAAPAPAATQPAGPADGSVLPAGQAGSPPPAPVPQIGHALAALHAGADGSSHVVVRLDPAELGQVQVRITRGHDGAASVSVAVERPETLRSLQADLGHLHQMLDRAGLPEQRSLTVHLAAQDAAPGLAAGNAGGQGDGGSQSRQQAGRQDRAGASHGAAGPPADAESGAFSPRQDSPLRWRRAGVNITA